MIEDLFFKRYEDRLFHRSEVHPEVSRVLNQAAYIFLEDVSARLGLDDSFFLSTERQLIRELGSNPFPGRYTSPYNRCESFLTSGHAPSIDGYGTADEYVKLRLSFIELLFRNAEREVAARADRDARMRAAERIRRAPLRDKDAGTLRSAIQELNARFRDAGVGLHYHNGLLQLAEDDLSQQRIAEPFWSIVSDPKWANVDHDMKEAVDRANTGRRDAAWYGAKALESTIKIISDEKGWTRGTEAGAHAFIDNLVSQRNGRFIDVGEAEALKLIFTNVRNPHGHGPGSAPQPTLTDYQTMWAIEPCMSWIKSLIRRL